MQQSSSPLLSVIIPVYNAAATIQQCLDSVRTQNISDIEILCVDDGSTDQSVEILNALAQEDPRIQIILQSNRSAGAARNNGLSYAKGEFVHFLDADDLLCPDIYKNSIARLEKYRAHVCFFQYKLLDSATLTQTKRPCLLNRKEQVITLHQDPAFFLYNMVAPWNKVYRRSWIEDHTLRFDEIVCGNDRGFYFRMLASNPSIVLSADYGVLYRVNSTTSLTGSGRWRHFGSLFYAWNSSVQAMAGEPPTIQAMLLDCIVRDTLELFARTPSHEKANVLPQLQKQFCTIDFSFLKSLPWPCIWLKTAIQIQTGQIPHSPTIWDRLKAQYVACKIWGLRGRLVLKLSK